MADDLQEVTIGARHAIDENSECDDEKDACNGNTEISTVLSNLLRLNTEDRDLEVNCERKPINIILLVICKSAILMMLLSVLQFNLMPAAKEEENHTLVDFVHSSDREKYTFTPVQPETEPAPDTRINNLQCSPCNKSVLTPAVLDKSQSKSGNCKELVFLQNRL